MQSPIYAFMQQTETIGNYAENCFFVFLFGFFFPLDVTQLFRIVVTAHFDSVMHI